MKPQNRGGFYDLFFGFRKNLVLILFVSVAVICGSALVGMAGLVFQVSPPIQLLMTIFLAIACTIVGSFMYVILDLPRVAALYDRIKDAIAAGEISSPDTYAQAIVTLMCEYFNFVFFNITHAFAKFKGGSYVFSSDAWTESLESQQFEYFLNQSKASEELLYAGAVNVGGSQGHLYLLPVWFRSEWLGCIGLVTAGRLPSLFRAFLSDFENMYIDDQLMYVMQVQKTLAQKQLFKAIDVVSNKISQKQYTDILQYMQDVSKAIVETVKCKGAVFGTVYCYEPACYFVEDVKGGEKLKEKYRGRRVPPQPTINEDPNCRDFKYVYRLPIRIDRVRGIIYLFDDNRETFDFFGDSLSSVENIKLDNDLETIAEYLGLQEITCSYVTTSQNGWPP